jgi:DNA-binding CsgD family transcriptional regulator
MDDERLKRVPRLSPREHETLKLVTKGASSRQLAKALGVSEQEAGGIVERLRRKVVAAKDIVTLRAACALKGARPEKCAPPSAEAAVDPAVWVGVFDAHPDPLMYLSRDCKILRVNSSQAGLLGLPPSACEGRYCYELFHGCDAPPEDCPFGSVLCSGEACTIDVAFEAAGHSYRVTVSPVKGAQGEVAGLLHTARRLGAGAEPEEPGGGQGAEPLAAGRNAWRALLDQLLAFVLRHLGEHARDSSLRAALLADLVALLADFQLSRVLLLEPGERATRTLFSHTFAGARRKGAASLCDERALESLARAARSQGFVKEARGGALRCAVAMSPGLAGGATYIMVAECRERAACSVFFRRDQMQFMCDVLGEIVHHAVAAGAEPQGQELTMREIAVMRLLEGDYVCKTIADQLGVSLHTVRVHTKNIYRKLNVHSRDEAVKRWRAQRWRSCRSCGEESTPEK